MTSNNFKTLRNKVGLTQEGMANLLKVKRSRLGAWEEGRADVPNKIIKKLVDFKLFSKSRVYDFMFENSEKFLRP